MTAPVLPDLGPDSFLDNLFFVLERWTQTALNYSAQDSQVVCYLSAEFLTWSPFGVSGPVI
jgi:hypothetical protein